MLADRVISTKSPVKVRISAILKRILGVTLTPQEYKMALIIVSSMAENRAVEIGIT